MDQSKCMEKQQEDDESKAKNVRKRKRCPSPCGRRKDTCKEHGPDRCRKPKKKYERARCPPPCGKRKDSCKEHGPDRCRQPQKIRKCECGIGWFWCKIHGNSRCPCGKEKTRCHEHGTGSALCACNVTKITCKIHGKHLDYRFCVNCKVTHVPNRGDSCAGCRSLVGGKNSSMCECNLLKIFCAKHGGSRLCSVCRYTTVHKKGTTCAGCTIVASKRARIKEKRVAAFLEESVVPGFTRWNKTLPDAGACGRFRPDFVWELTALGDAGGQGSSGSTSASCAGALGSGEEELSGAVVGGGFAAPGMDGAGRTESGATVSDVEKKEGDLIPLAKDVCRAVVVEVDENQHKYVSYPLACELSRMGNIVQSYGGLPVRMIRYNPDRFNVDSFAKKPRYPEKFRLEALARTLKAAFEDTNFADNLFTLQYLFYDNEEGSEILQTYTFKSIEDYAAWMDEKIEADKAAATSSGGGHDAEAAGAGGEGAQEDEEAAGADGGEAQEDEEAAGADIGEEQEDEEDMGADGGYAVENEESDEY